MQVKSTSLHTLNADKDLNRLEQTLWLLFNWLNNRFFPNAHGFLSIQEFIADLSEHSWNQIYHKSSPARALSDLFWMQLPWDEIQDELGQLRVLDVGCGSGNYFPRLQTFSRNRIAAYTGVDIAHHENWETLQNKYAEVQFQRLNSNCIQTSIPEDTDLIISQSALEHFEQDVTFFDQIRNFIKRTSKNVLQIHLLPSSACLRLYGYHGVRQYTPRSLSMITGPFSEFSYAVVYQLGGNDCNRLHWNAITRPSQVGKPDLRNVDPELYEQELRQAIRTDNRQSHPNPSFYALVIHSNARRVLFK